MTNFSREKAEFDASVLEGAELVISSAGKSGNGGVEGVLAPLEAAVYERKLDK